MNSLTPPSGDRLEHALELIGALERGFEQLVLASTAGGLVPPGLQDLEQRIEALRAFVQADPELASSALRQDLEQVLEGLATRLAAFAAEQRERDVNERARALRATLTPLLASGHSAWFRIDLGAPGGIELRAIVR